MICPNYYATTFGGFWTEANLERFASGKYEFYIYHYAYPLDLVHKDEDMEELLSWMKDMNIWRIGNWGEWQHFYSDVVVDMTLKLTNICFEINIELQFEDEKMIVDSINNLQKYIPEDSYCKIVSFLDKLTSDMEEGLYPIDGDNIYAKVMSYPTSPKEKCKIEAHNIYVDIQSTLVGSEGIDVFDRDSLKFTTEYDPHNDVIFYEETVPAYLSVDNQPGRFSMIFPEEAHRPQISMDGQNAVVKKFVIKIKRDILTI